MGIVIRQIAALPYRLDDPNIHASVRVLLVTSRGTGRWVVPKGNTMSGKAAHVAAAQEAEEEAGVVGRVCSTPLGSYCYRKRRGGGASQMMDVDVFPLAVTRELAAWKEQGQRERRWFTLAEAADAVDEPDLGILIRSFDATAQNLASASIIRRGSTMRWEVLPNMGLWIIPASAAVGVVFYALTWLF